MLICIKEKTTWTIFPIINTHNVKIDTFEWDMCQRTFTVAEVITAINDLKPSKTPGLDGLTAEFYQTFKNELAPLLLQNFANYYESKEIPQKLKMGILNLIPKRARTRVILKIYGPLPF